MYDKMQVSMRNGGTPSYQSILNTTNNTFYDMSRDYTYTYNTAYYNSTYNSYYIPVTYNDVDYNYFITYAPTYTNITYIVDGCNDPSQAVSNNYYFQLPDGRNSYDLTADEVLGIPLAGDVVNYDAVPENDNCVALYHFDGNIVDASGNVNAASFTDGTVPQYISSNSFGKYLFLSPRGYFNLGLSETLEAPYTIEFRVNYGDYVPFSHIDSDLKKTTTGDNYVLLSGVTHSDTSRTWRDTNVRLRILERYTYTANYYEFYFWGDDAGAQKTRFGYYWLPNTLTLEKIASGYYGYGSNNSSVATSPFFPLSESKLSSNYLTVRNSYVSQNSVSSSSCAQFSYSGVSSNNSNPIPRGQWVNFAIVNDGDTVKYFMNGVAFTPPSNWIVSNGNITGLSFFGAPGFTYSYYDELRISKGTLYTENYTPATAPFDIPMAQ